MRLTSRELEQKNTADAERISQYKKQIAQLAACIADREGRIRRRLPIIEKISQREIAAHDLQILKANSHGLLELGKVYKSENGLHNLGVLDGVYRLYTNGFAEFASPDIKLLSEMFFYDNPDAKVILTVVDK